MIKSIINQLEAILVIISKDILSLLLLHILLKEYHIFKKLLMDNDNLSIFLELESKLLDEEMQIHMDMEKETSNEVFYMRKGNSSRSNKKVNTSQFSRGI